MHEYDNMALPTEQQVRTELMQFSKHTNYDIKQKALNLLQYLDRLSQQKLNEDEIHTLADDLTISSQNIAFETVQGDNISFKKALYHAFLCVIYQFPRNAKIEDDIPVDLITQDPILKEHLFISFDQRHWDVNQLIKWFKHKRLLENPHSQALFSPQEIYWIRKISDPALARAITNISSNDDHTVCDGLLYIMQQSNHSIFEITPRLVEFLSVSNDNIVQQAISIALLARFSWTHSLYQGAIRSIRDIPDLDDFNVDIVGHVVRALTLVCSDNDTLQEVIHGADAIPVLVAHLNNPNERIVRLVIQTLLRLSQFDNADKKLLLQPTNTNLEAILNAGAVPVLVAYLTHPDESILQFSIEILKQLSMSKTTNHLAPIRDTLPVLVGLLNHSNEILVQNVIMIFSHLSTFKGKTQYAEQHVNKEAIRAAGAIPVLVTLLGHSNKNIVQNAAEALKCLSHVNSVNQAAIHNAGAIPVLVAYARHSNEKFVLMAIKTLTWLTYNKSVQQHAAQQDAMRNAGAISVLIPHLMHSNEDIVKAVALALTYLSSNNNTANQEAICSAGGIPALVAHLGHTEEWIVNYAVIVLAHVTWRNATNQTTLRDTLGLEETGRQAERVPAILQLISFDVFVETVLNNAMKVCMRFSNSVSFDGNNEMKFAQYVTFLQSIVMAKKNLLVDMDEVRFNADVLQAIENAKPHISGSVHGAIRRFFNAEESFAQKVQQMENSLHAISEREPMGSDWIDLTRKLL